MNLAAPGYVLFPLFSQYDTLSIFSEEDRLAPM